MVEGGVEEVRERVVEGGEGERRWWFTLEERGVRWSRVARWKVRCRGGSAEWPRAFAVPRWRQDAPGPGLSAIGADVGRAKGPGLHRLHGVSHAQGVPSGLVDRLHIRQVGCRGVATSRGCEWGGERWWEEEAPPQKEEEDEAEGVTRRRGRGRKEAG